MPRFKRSFNALKKKVKYLNKKIKCLNKQNNTCLLFLQVSMFSKYSLCSDIVWPTKKLNNLVNLKCKKIIL